MINQEQQFLLKNLQNMVSYIKNETEKKAKTIRNEADSTANACNIFIYTLPFIILVKSKMMEPEKEKVRARVLKEIEEYKVRLKMYEIF